MKKFKKTTLFLSVLIIGLFSFLPGWGQERTLLHDSCINIFNEGESDSLRSDEYLIVGLIFLYDEYAKICYADSTDMGWGLYMSDMGSTWWTPMDSTSNIFTKPFHRYDHREPTFQGFIGFLRGQGKKSK